MWRSSLIQSLAASFLMLVLMLDAGFDYDSKNFKSPFHKAQNSGRTIMSRSTSMSMREKAEHRTPNIEHRTSRPERARHAVAPAKAGTLNTLTRRKRLRLTISHLPSSIFQTLARVVEWQTRTFEGRMPKGMRVQVPPRAIDRFAGC